MKTLFHNYQAYSFENEPKILALHITPLGLLHAAEEPVLLFRL